MDRPPRPVPDPEAHEVLVGSAVIALGPTGGSAQIKIDEGISEQSARYAICLLLRGGIAQLANMEKSPHLATMETALDLFEREAARPLGVSA